MSFDQILQTVRKSYFEYFDEHESDYDDKTLNLVHAVADYGYYAQPYLIRVHKLGDKYAKIEKHYVDAFDYDAVEAYNEYQHRNSTSDTRRRKTFGYFLWQQYSVYSA